jgi:copper oxidase (laccase) domain-containing protein
MLGGLMAAMLSKLRSIHFFGTRQDGVNQSADAEAWRYGKGNVFSPSAEHSEFKNANANILAILEESQIKNTHPGVILQSQYGKGISQVTEEFLAADYHTRDKANRIVIMGDGLFTMLDSVPLLNRSGDAHAIIFEGQSAEGTNAIGILVGAWKCLSKDIFNLMLDKFKANGIDNERIHVRVGPGLGKDSFSIGNQPRAELEKVFGNLLNQVLTLKKDKAGQDKYVLDVPGLLQAYAKIFGFGIDISKSQNTFDKSQWKAVKEEAIRKKDPELPIKYYTESTLFSARLYTRCDRLARRIARENGLPLPKLLATLADNIDPDNLKTAGQTGRYNETGRCLNGVMLRPASSNS